MNVQTCPRLVFPEGFDDRAAFEMTDKGWFSAEVEMKDGSRFCVYFSDPVRLQQDLQDEVTRGRPYIAEPGLIVLPEVTVEAIQDAVQVLSEQGFFARFQPCQTEARAATHENGS